MSGSGGSHTCTTNTSTARASRLDKYLVVAEESSHCCRDTKALQEKAAKKAAAKAEGGGEPANVKAKPAKK